MNIDALHKMSSITYRPGTSSMDRLILLRMQVIHSLGIRREILDERRQLRRQARKLAKHLPFTEYSINRLREQARDFRSEDLDIATQLITAIGGLLMTETTYYAEIGFAQACDFLNINQADRAAARAANPTCLADLIFTERLENSAEHPHRHEAPGGPLYQACLKAAVKFMRECPDQDLGKDPVEWMRNAAAGVKA